MYLLLITLLGVLLCMLAVPVVIDFSVRKDAAFSGTMEIHWLFGLIRVAVPIETAPRSATKTPSAISQTHKARRVPDRKSRLRERGSLTKALGSRHFRYRVYRLARTLLHAVQVSRFLLRLELGLDDPADTGRLWALLGPVAGVLGTLRRVTVRLAPNFTGAIFTLESRGQVRFMPLQLVYVIVGFLLSPVTLRAIFNMGR